MKDLWPGHRFTNVFERVVLSVFQLLLMLIITLGVLDIAFLLISRIPLVMGAIDSGEQLQEAILRGYSVALLILIGLELLETARVYRLDHYVRVEVVLIVAIIAISRHIILIDPHESGGLSLLGFAALMASVTAGYYLVRLRASERKTKSADDPPEAGVEP